MEKIAAIVPVYNSEKSLKPLFLQLKKALENYKWEVVFVDDFSLDKSWKVLNQLKEENPQHVKAIRLAKNYGQHNATFCGFNFVTADYVVTIDDDLQYLPAEIPLLLKTLKKENADLVYGIGNQQHAAYRKLGSKIFKFGTKALEDGIGQGSSFRLFTKDLLEKVVKHNQHFIYLDELLYWYTENIGFVEVTHQKRQVGKSNYNAFKIFNILKNTTLAYGKWPLKFMVYGGSFFSFVSFLTGLYFIAKKLIFGIAVPGFTALMVSILFSTSLILLCFGILGKYLMNVYVLLNQKPAYSIKEMR